MRIHDWTGGMLLNPIPLPTHGAACGSDYNPGGAPTIADFDGDGMPEIGGGPAVWINKHSGCVRVMEHMK